VPIRDETGLRLLRHELQIVQWRLDEELAKLPTIQENLTNAVEQSSESWHDNAPGDSAKEEFEKVSGQVKSLSYITLHHVAMDYPDENSEKISIGSGFRLEVPSWGEIIDAVIIGDVRHLYPRNMLLEDRQLLTLSSLIGGVIVGLSTGDVASTEINGMQVELIIQDINQLVIFDVARLAIEELTKESYRQSPTI
jgi:transcription elongation GreA/GreB family factor